MNKEMDIDMETRVHENDSENWYAWQVVRVSVYKWAVCYRNSFSFKWFYKLSRKYGTYKYRYILLFSAFSTDTFCDSNKWANGKFMIYLYR